MEYYNNDYLMHYGVKGMKWGVRRYQNADGTLTVAGKERLYKSVKKTYDKTGYSDASRKISKNKLLSGMHDSLKEKREALEKADYLSKEFQTNKEVFNKYLKKAHGKNAYEKAIDYQDSNMDYYVGGKAFKLYLKDKGVNPKQYADNVQKAEWDYMDECQKVAKSVLGDIGDRPLGKYDKYSGVVTSALIARAEDEWRRNHLYARGYDLN